MRAHEIGLSGHHAADHIIDVPVKALARMYTPFEIAPWRGMARINPQAITRAIAQRDFAVQPEDSSDLASPDPSYHVRRIAYLVAHPDPEPIVIVPNVRGSFTLEDGFHRLCAAIYRGDRTIKAAFGGTGKQLRSWLGM